MENFSWKGLKFGFFFLRLVIVNIREVESEMGISLQIVDFHQIWFKCIKLVHEIVYSLCKSENYFALLKIVYYGLLISYSVRVDHDVVLEKHLRPFNESCKWTVYLLDFIKIELIML